MKRIFDKGKRNLNRQALKIAIIYLVFGCLWILFSDELTIKIFSDMVVIHYVAILKGWFYVLITSIILFYLVLRGMVQIDSSNKSNEKIKTLLVAVLESSPDVIVFSLDNDYCYTSFNSKHKFTMQQIWGKDITLGANMLEIVGTDEDRQKAKMNFDRSLAGESFSVEEEFGDEKLSRLYWNDFYSPIKADSGEIIGLTCFAINITSQKQAEENRKELLKEVQNKHALLKGIMDSIPDIVFYKDCNGVYRGCNSAFEKFVGKKEAQIVGNDDYYLTDRDWSDYYRSADREVLGSKVNKKYDAEYTNSDGSKTIFETLKTPCFDSENNVVGIIGIARDITDRRKKEEEILSLTFHDTLTGLHNRTYFTKELQAIDNAQHLPLSVITGDINGLKLINDAFGHEEGDKCLKDIAFTLSQHVRPGDVLARIGGDEFCMLLPNTDAQAAQAIVDDIMKACDNHMRKTDSAASYASIALGNATKTSDAESYEKVFKIAEELMYRKKMLNYKSQYSTIIASIKSTMFEKSHETEEHAERLAELSKQLGFCFGLTDKELVELELLSTLHDIGKISIDASILTKCGALTENEWQHIKKHPEVGFRITQSIPELKHIAEFILCHHERWDGRGYPQGLSGENIPLLSRILTIVDSYDAMTQDRVYRKAMSKEEAIAEIQANEGKQFDPVISKLFIEKVLSLL